LSQHPDERSGEEVANLLIDSAVRFIVMDGIEKGISFTEREQETIRSISKATIGYLMATARQHELEDETGRLLATLAMVGEG